MIAGAVLPGRFHVLAIPLVERAGAQTLAVTARGRYGGWAMKVAPRGCSRRRRGPTYQEVRHGRR